MMQQQRSLLLSVAQLFYDLEDRVQSRKEEWKGANFCYQFSGLVETYQAVSSRTHVSPFFTHTRPARHNLAHITRIT